MVDERFSAARFAVLGVDTLAARRLAEELSEAISDELHEAVAVVIKGVVARLNAMGHALKVEQFVPGDVSYRDDFEDKAGYHCRLRLAVDTIVSSGYAHLTHALDDGDELLN